METEMRNIQHRLINAPADTLGGLLDSVATEDRTLWPTGWPPLVLDAGLTPGSRGGHGLIRYSVAEYEPGRRVRFCFDPGLGLDGYHELRITSEGPQGCRLTHTIDSTIHGRAKVLWPLMIRWLHEALTEDLFDNAERAATGRLRGQPARWSLWVRLLRRARGLPAVRDEEQTGAVGLP
jgi:hypothetical protein